jgi:tetratricopeptide (TPR) repeat protein
MNNPNLNPDEQQKKLRSQKLVILMFCLFLVGGALNLLAYSLDISHSNLLQAAGGICWITAIVVGIMQIRRLKRAGIIKGQFQQQDLKQRLKILLPSIIIFGVINIVVDSFVDSDSPLSFIVPLITAIVLSLVWYVMLRKRRGKVGLPNEGFPQEQFQTKQSVKWLFGIGMLVLLIATIWVYFAETSPTVIDYVHNGAEAYDDGNYYEAISYFNQSLDIDSDYAPAYLWRGATYTKLGKMNEALADFNQSILLGPGDAEDYQWRGATYYTLGYIDEALADFNQSIMLDPNNALTYDWRGVAYNASGETELAIADFQKCLTLNPDAETRQAVETRLQELGVTQ